MTLPNWLQDPATGTIVAVLIFLATCTGVYPLYRKRREKEEAAKPRAQAPDPQKPSIAVGIVQRGNQVILVRRVKAEHGILWRFPAGMINPKRTDAENAIREVREETDVECRIVAELGQRIHPNTGAKVVYFHCLYEGGDLTNGDPKENSEVKWMPGREVGSLVTSDLFTPIANLLRTIDA